MNDNKNDIEHAVATILHVFGNKLPAGCAHEVRRVVNLYAQIERDRALRDVLAIPIDIHTSLADYCAKVRELAERPYRAS